MSKKVKRKTKYDGWLMQSSRIPLTINCDDEKLKDKHWQSFRDALKPFGEVGTIIVRQCAGLLWGLIARKRKNGVPVSIDSQMYSIISKFIDKNRKKQTRVRLRYILAQIYQKMGKLASASLLYDKVIRHTKVIVSTEMPEETRKNGVDENTQDIKDNE